MATWPSHGDSPVIDDPQFIRDLFGMLMACLVREGPGDKWVGINVGDEPGQIFLCGTQEEAVDMVLSSADDFAVKVREEYRRARASKVGAPS